MSLACGSLALHLLTGWIVQIAQTVQYVAVPCSRTAELSKRSQLMSVAAHAKCSTSLAAYGSAAAQEPCMCAQRSIVDTASSSTTTITYAGSHFASRQTAVAGGETALCMRFAHLRIIALVRSLLCLPRWQSCQPFKFFSTLSDRYHCFVGAASAPQSQLRNLQRSVH